MVGSRVLQRVILIADVAAEELLIREIERLRFVAFASVNCSGRASQPAVDDVFMPSSHVRIEALAPAFLVEQLVQFVQDRMSRYSVTCFTDSVEVSGAVRTA